MKWLARALIFSGEWMTLAAVLVMARRRTALPFLPIVLPEILQMPGKGRCVAGGASAMVVLQAAPVGVRCACG